MVYLLKILNLYQSFKIRPSDGPHPKYYCKILGKKVNKDISAITEIKIGHNKF